MRCLAMLRITAIAAAVGFAAAIHHESCLQTLIDGSRLAGERPTEARLAGFPFTRSTQVHSTGLLSAAANILAIAPHSPADTHSRGIAMLIMGERDEAVQQLSRVASGSSESAPWSDLAAARYEQGRQTNDPQMLAQAVADADHAIDREPSMPAAHFNRGMALAALGLRRPAADAFRHALAIETQIEWREETLRRFKAERLPTLSDEWRRVKPTLDAACNRDARAEVIAIVRRFPEPARRTGEGEQLTAWGEQVLAGNSTGAAHSLAFARCVGSALAAAQGNALLNDIVAATGEAPDGDRRKLASAFAAYKRGRIAFGKRNVAESLPSFAEAERGFKAISNPMWLVVAYYRANVLMDQRDVLSAIALLDSVEKAAKPRYVSLRSEVLWTRGTALARLGRTPEAAETSRHAAEAFTQLGEIDNAARVHVSIGSSLSALGQPRAAWPLWRDAFVAAGRSGNTSVLELALDTAARGAVHDEQWAIARSLFNIEATLPSASPRLRFDALLWKTFSSARLRQGGESDLTTALSAAGAIPDPILRADAVDDGRFVQALLIRNHDPRRARELLTRIIEGPERPENLQRIPNALIERAHIERLLGNNAAAINDLWSAIRHLESIRGKIDRDDLRETFFGRAQPPFEALVDIHIMRGANADAFRAAERGRARLILDRIATSPTQPATPLDLQQICLRLPAGVLIAEYVALPDRMIVFTVSRDGLQSSVVRVRKQQVAAAVVGLRDAIRRNDDVAIKATALGAWMITPIAHDLASATTLVIVPDDVFAGCPFAALIHPATGRYLAEEIDTVVAPSSSAFIAVRDSMQPASPPRVAVLGDPDFDANLYRLSRLPAAAAEARAVGKLYGTDIVATGSRVTRARLIDAIQTSDLIHLASHAVVNDRDPAMSALPLSPIPDDAEGALYVRDVAALRLPRHPIVYLSTCRAGDGATGGSTDSFALSFLAAGAGGVIATSSDVSDEAAKTMALAIHRELKAGAGPAVALRRAQLAMIHSSVAHLRRVDVWSSYTVYGGVAATYSANSARSSVYHSGARGTRGTTSPGENRHG